MVRNMPHEPWIWTSEHHVPSRCGAHHEAVEGLIAALEANAWSKEDVFGVQLAMVEAVVNAMKHGNRYDPNKSVHVVCKLGPETLRVEISDEGAGFVPDAVPDPTTNENLEIPSGRGIHLIRSYMSGVTFNESGTCLVMEKRRGENHPCPPEGSDGPNR